MCREIPAYETGAGGNGNCGTGRLFDAVVRQGGIGCGKTKWPNLFCEFRLNYERNHSGSGSGS